MKELIIDRFEEGYVVCQTPEGKLDALRREQVPANAVEGSWLVIQDDGTVIIDEEKTLRRRAVTEAKAGKIEYRLDKANIIHVPIGKASFGAEKLGQNLSVVMEAIVKAKPAAAKGQYIKSATVASTMGPGIKLNSAKFGG